MHPHLCDTRLHCLRQVSQHIPRGVTLPRLPLCRLLQLLLHPVLPGRQEALESSTAVVALQQRDSSKGVCCCPAAEALLRIQGCKSTTQDVLPAQNRTMTSANTAMQEMQEWDWNVIESSHCFTRWCESPSSAA